MKKISHSEQETFAFAQEFARKLKGGETLALSGELGAGKTAFTKGLASGLGIKGTVSSPTFVLMKVYPVPVPKGGKRLPVKVMVHVDAYRVAEADALAGIGLEDYISSPEAVVVIEWAERVKKIIPRDAWKILFEHRPDGGRTIRVEKARIAAASKRPRRT